MSRSTARDEILGVFATALAASGTYSGAPVYYQDNIEDPLSSAPVAGAHRPQIWIRVELEHVSGRQASIASPAGMRRYERTALLFVKIYTPLGDGLSQSDEVAQLVLDAYEGEDTPSGVWFRNGRAAEIGPDGTWFQVNVTIECIYDEVK